MSALILQRIAFTKGDLLAVSSEEKVVFTILVGSLLQETVLLQKLIIFSIQKTDDTEESRAAVAQSMYLLRYLGAHLFEGWRTLRKSSYGRINADFDGKLSDDGKSALQELQVYFSKKDNACEKLRNDHAYHRDSGGIRNLFRQIKNEERLDVLLHETYANCRFTAFEIVVNLSVLGTSEVAEIRIPLENLMNEVIKIAKLFMDLLGEYTKIFFGEIDNLETEEVLLSDVPLLNTIWIPYFTTQPGPSRASTSSARTGKPTGSG
ncbi:MAG: hypothetical protein HY211_00960 [Candidatus Omnitrophica bacterium]|nr:hypothetical protein [Candidatus Omnitrophota bacterium]